MCIFPKTTGCSVNAHNLKSTKIKKGTTYPVEQVLYEKKKCLHMTVYNKRITPNPHIKTIMVQLCVTVNVYVT